MIYKGERVNILALGYGYAAEDSYNNIEKNIYHMWVSQDGEISKRYVEKLPSDCPEED
mgnify:CR=1 FL=1